jgi:hypothetical protein
VGKVLEEMLSGDCVLLSLVVEDVVSWDEGVDGLVSDEKSGV